MEFVFKCVLAFFCTALSDYVWGRWIASVQSRAALASGFWSAGTVLIGTTIVLLVVDDKWLLPAEVLGAFVGGYFAVSRLKKEETTQS